MCTQEIYRVLKPGAFFAGYEWCSTDLNDPNNPTHKAILDEIELGNGLPDIRSTEQVRGFDAAAVMWLPSCLFHGWVNCANIRQAGCLAGLHADGRMLRVNALAAG